jgi:hypothetical protein
LIEGGPPGLDAYRPQLRYLLIDESAYADVELASMSNLVATLLRLEHSQGPEVVHAVLAILVEWLKEPAQAELRRSFLLWLRAGFLQARLPQVSFPEPNDLEEARIMLTERVVEWTEQIARQRGMEKGIGQGQIKLLTAMLRPVPKLRSSPLPGDSRSILEQGNKTGCLEMGILR